MGPNASSGYLLTSVLASGKMEGPPVVFAASQSCVLGVRIFHFRDRVCPDAERGDVYLFLLVMSAKRRDKCN